MDIKLLEDFVCLANLQNFTAAALKRHITQSALSRRIKSLEQWLGTQLVNRDNSTFGLTPQGTLFVTEAKAILRSLYNARDAVRKLGANGESEICVAAQNSIAQTLFLSWVKRLESHLDSVYVRLISEKISDCIDLLNQGDVDYMFCYASDKVGPYIDEKKFAYTIVGRETLIPVCVPRPHSTEPAFELPGSPDSPIPFVAYTQDALFGRAIEQIMQDGTHECYLARRYENAFSHTLKSMICERLGFAWLPLSSIMSELSEGKLCRAGDEHWDIEFDIRLYYHHAANSKRERAVLETSLDMARELSK